LHKEDSEQHTKISIVLAEEVTFLNKGAILKELKRIPEGSTITIDATQSQSIDYDVLEIIENFKDGAANKNIKVEFRTKK
jgi:MFS superfamily sulfate permease-like transporter